MGSGHTGRREHDHTDDRLHIVFGGYGNLAIRAEKVGGYHAGNEENTHNLEIRGGQTGYLIVFYGNGGSCDVFSAYTDADGRLAELPAATREGYNFLGWQTEDGTDVTTDTVFTGDAVVFAQWETPTATITLLNDGSERACYVIIDDVVVVSAGSYEVHGGDTIICCVHGLNNTVKVNGSIVENSSSSIDYYYTVTTDVTISFTSPASMSPTLEITET